MEMESRQKKEGKEFSKIFFFFFFSLKHTFFFFLEKKFLGFLLNGIALDRVYE